MRVTRHYPVVGSLASRVDQYGKHLTSDLLWKVIKGGGTLDPDHMQHAKECRDCREFVKEFSIEAHASGCSFPDLLPDFEAEVSAN